MKLTKFEFYVDNKDVGTVFSTIHSVCVGGINITKGTPSSSNGVETQEGTTDTTRISKPSRARSNSNKFVPPTRAKRRVLGTRAGDYMLAYMAECDRFTHEQLIQESAKRSPHTEGTMRALVSELKREGYMMPVAHEPSTKRKGKYVTYYSKTPKGQREALAAKTGIDQFQLRLNETPKANRNFAA